jgi:hypothetical protein
MSEIVKANLSDPSGIETPIKPRLRLRSAHGMPLGERNIQGNSASSSFMAWSWRISSLAAEW